MSRSSPTGCDKGGVCLSFFVCDSFVDAFRTALGERDPRITQADTLHLRRILADAVRAWPDVSLDPRAFGAVLGKNVRSWGGKVELERVAAGDLYLAAACVAGD